MSENKFQTREQRYADAVYKLVDNYRKDQQKKLKKTDPKEREEELTALCKPYGSMAHKLPVLIRTAGLAQTLAFVEARNKEGTPQRLLLQHLNEAVSEVVGGKAIGKVVFDKNNLVALSRTVSVSEYIYLTNEVLATLLWFKRYAQSVLKIEASDEVKEGDNV